MILPTKCPRMQTGCCALIVGKEKLPEKYSGRCERMEEYVYCEHYSSGVWGQSSSIQVTNIVQSFRRL